MLCPTVCARILIVSLLWLQGVLYTTVDTCAEAQPTTGMVHASGQVSWPLTLRDRFGITFILIPAGEFMMGSSAEDIKDAIRNFSHDLKREWIADEMPQHRVRISRPFYLSKFEITQSQWASVMGNNPSRFRHDQHPVENVSWWEANEFIGQLNARTAGAPYRLPTEAEWEYAARGSDGRRYPWGNVFEASRLNFCDRHCAYGWNDKLANDGHRGTAPVGSYASGVSPFGVHDMLGNVWEWVQDRYGRYGNNLAKDPVGPSSGPYRVMRGGSWDNNPGLCRAATRLHVAPEHRFDFADFRLVRTQP
ncbi:formylglycine-generating enzyme family protein [Candidatus Entotheonella serta]|nr:formylglycine-generating enzyme family protein [Candidatus Entotheonella serta]